MKLLVITHKDYIFPENKIYYPILVGKDLHKINLKILADNVGENISLKNQSFCELTGLYWAFKNQEFLKDAEFVGLVHYRRYFKGKLKFLNKKILREKEIQEIFATHQIILGRKRNYFIETIYSHYKHAHNITDLEETRKIILEKYPDYIPSFDELMQEKKLSLYNMFVADKKFFLDYCQWLFDILFELEQRINITNYDNYQKRVFGFIAERLLNVYVRKNKLKVKEIKVVNLEGENLIKKAINLLKRKFFR